MSQEKHFDVNAFNAAIHENAIIVFDAKMTTRLLRIDSDGNSYNVRFQDGTCVKDLTETLLYYHIRIVPNTRQDLRKKYFYNADERDKRSRWTNDSAIYVTVGKDLLRYHTYKEIAEIPRVGDIWKLKTNDMTMIAKYDRKGDLLVKVSADNKLVSSAVFFKPT